MSDESPDLPPSAEATPAKKTPAKKAVKKATKKTAKKATAKKATTKKAATKKTAAKKATTKKATTKKIATAQPELALEKAPAAAPTPTPTPNPAPAAPAEAAPPPPAPAPATDATPADTPAPRESRDDRNPRESREPRESRGEGEDDSNRTKRWKERKNRFKKWKERRRRGRKGGGGGGGDQGGGGGGNHTDNQAVEFTPPENLEGPPVECEGLLELTAKGTGFLRQRAKSYTPLNDDPFVSPNLISQFGLREGMHVKGTTLKGPRGPHLTEVKAVNGEDPKEVMSLPLFEELKAINPDRRLQLETSKDRFTTRVMDIITPVGRGQRGLIVAPPRTGKTTLLQHVAEAVLENHEGTHVMLVLVDERPEEVTEFKRVLPQAEIFASSNDSDNKSHIRIASFAIERAKRLVECGKDVFILMDSITRLARAFNNASKKGATMSGGVGVGALETPRRLFAAARNTREAGSLTVLATALIETGSRMDDLIFQEFKGTGNLELVLDRRIAEQFYYPAVNIFKSGTRREELLLQEFQLNKIHMLRRGLAGHKPIEALQRVLSLLERYPSNAQMLVDLPSKS